MFEFKHLGSDAMCSVAALLLQAQGKPRASVPVLRKAWPSAVHLPHKGSRRCERAAATRASLRFDWLDVDVDEGESGLPAIEQAPLAGRSVCRVGS